MKSAEVETKNNKRAAATCAFCGEPIEVPPGPGRRPRYCRPSHRQRAYEERRLNRARQAGMVRSTRSAAPDLPPVAKSGDPKRRIAAAARALLAECGLEGTTMRAIADRAGVAYGTVSYHCGTKEELLIQVLQTEGCKLQRDAERTWEIPDLSSRRRSLTEEMRTRVERQPEVFKLRFEMFALALRNEPYRSEVAKLLQSARASVGESLVKAGFRDEDSLRLAPLVLAAIDGLALQALVDPDFDHSAAHGLLTLLLGQFRRVRESATDRAGRTGEQDA